MSGYLRVLPGAGAATVQLHLPRAPAVSGANEAAMAAAAAAAGFRCRGLPTDEFSWMYFQSPRERTRPSLWERAYAPGVLDSIVLALAPFCEVIGLQGARSVAEELLEYAPAMPASARAPTPPPAAPCFRAPAATARPPALPPSFVSLRLDRQRCATYVFGGLPRDTYVVKEVLDAYGLKYLKGERKRVWGAPALLGAATVEELRAAIEARGLFFETVELPLAAAAAAAAGHTFIPCGGEWAVLCSTHSDVYARRVVRPGREHAGRAYFKCQHTHPKGDRPYMWEDDVLEMAMRGYLQPPATPPLKRAEAPLQQPADAAREAARKRQRVR